MARGDAESAWRAKAGKARNDGKGAGEVAVEMH